MVRRVAHVITGLPRGGAEMMLYKLLSRMDRSRFEAEVIALKDEGPMAERIRALGVPVDSLGMRAGLADLPAILRLRRRLAERPPDLIQTWLYHADLIGGLAAKLAGSMPVVWGVRMSALDPGAIKPSTIGIARFSARLSRWLPTRIVCCSEAGRRVHAELGYDARKMVLIPNGFDLEVFRPDPEARASVLRELALPDASHIVGLVARFHPQKDHESLLEAAADLARRIPTVHFVLLGDGIEWTNDRLVGWIERNGIRERCRLLGPRNDVPRLTAAFNVAVSASSFGEAFANAIGEAMACGVPCVVTDVGDSAWIVGDTGRAVAPRDPAALAAAIGGLLRLNEEARRQLGLAARRRILENFELSSVVRRYEELYTELTDHVRH